MGDNSEAKYEIRKTLRFKLKPCTPDALCKTLQPLDNTKDDDRLLDEFISDLKYIEDQVKKVFFYDKETTESSNPNIIPGKAIKKYDSVKLMSKLSVKYPFLKKHTKTDFYTYLEKIEQQKKNNSNTHSKEGEGKLPKTYVLSTVDYLPKRLQEWVNEWIEIYSTLEYLNNKEQQEKHAQERRRDFAFQIKRLLKRSNLEFIKEFVEHIHNPNVPEYTNYGITISVDRELTCLKERIDAVNTARRRLERRYLPSQTLGVELARATFNYYTLNKTPKEYDKEIKNIEVGKRKPWEREIRINKDKQRERVISDYHDLIKRINLPGVIEQPLDAAYSNIKEWKAERKKKFEEAIKKLKRVEDLTYEKFNEIQKTHPLFASHKGYLEKYLVRTIKIERLATIRNKIMQGEVLSAEDKEYLSKHELDRTVNKIKDAITKTKKDRGVFYNFSKHDIQTRGYHKLCNLFKQIAIKNGQLRAQSKGLEYEKVDAELLSFWACIMEKDTRHHLVLIPKPIDAAAKGLIDTPSELQEENSQQVKLYTFRSLTMHALEKLCFKEYDNTFRPEVRKEVKDKYMECYPSYKSECYKGKSEEEQNLYLIEFYKNVLKTDYAKKEVAKYIGIDKITEKDYKEFSPPLDEFRKDLERCCYVKIIIKNEHTIDRLQAEHNAQIFLIDSLDLRLEQEKDKDTSLDKTTQKPHTRIWKEFWSKENKDKEYPTRLNPEFRIFWREAKETRVKKYGKESTNYKEHYNNRFLYPQYTLAVTYTLNAPNKKTDFAWNTEEELEEKINKFNNELENRPGAKWLYGIDRGENELATLCVTDLSKVQTKELDNIKNDIHNVEFPEITLSTLKRNKYYYQTEERTLDDLGSEDKGVGGPIKNISQVIEKIKDQDWFDTSRSRKNACIDLTTAKVIKGHIVSNGDLQTLLALKETAAKRKIYDSFYAGKINKETKFEFDGDKINAPYFRKIYVRKKCNKFYTFPEPDNQLKGVVKNYAQSVLENKEFTIKDNQYDIEAAKSEISKRLEDIANKSEWTVVEVKMGFILESKKEKDKEYYSYEKPTLYKLRNEYAEDETFKNNLKKELEEYLKRLDQQEDTSNEKKERIGKLTIERINNLRDAITANMVGIIDFLNKEYPAQKIVLENLDQREQKTGQKFIENHLERSAEVVSRRLEWALYRKFQNYGLVPPNIKQTVLLKDKFNEREENIANQRPQFGIIQFVNTVGTSANCPVCGKNNSKKQPCEKAGGCGFGTETNNTLAIFRDRDKGTVNWDKVGAFNIAKRGRAII